MPKEELSFDFVVKMADNMLYDAKKQGAIRWFG